MSEPDVPALGRLVKEIAAPLPLALCLGHIRRLLRQHNINGHSDRSPAAGSSEEIYDGRDNAVAPGITGPGSLPAAAAVGLQLHDHRIGGLIGGSRAGRDSAASAAVTHVRSIAVEDRSAIAALGVDDGRCPAIPRHPCAMSGAPALAIMSLHAGVAGAGADIASLTVGKIELIADIR